MSNNNTVDPKVLARMQKEVSFIASQQRGARRIKLEKGHNIIVRFLPARLGPDGMWYARLAKHWLNKVPIVCPRLTGDDFGGDIEADCPVCLLADELNDDKDKATSDFGWKVAANPQYLTYCLLWEKDGVQLPMEEVVNPYEYLLQKTSWEELKGFYIGGARRCPDSVLDYRKGNDFSIIRAKSTRLDKLDSQPIFDEDKDFAAYIKKIEAALKNPKVQMPTPAQLEAFADKVQEAAIQLHRDNDDRPRSRRASRDDDREADEAPRARRGRDEDEAPKSRRDRDEDEAPRSRRSADEAEAPRARRSTEEEEDAPPPRRSAAREDDEAPRARRGRDEDQEDAPRRSREAEDEAPRRRRPQGDEQSDEPRNGKPAPDEDDQDDGDLGPQRRRSADTDPEAGSRRKRDEDPDRSRKSDREEDPDSRQSRKRDEDPEARSAREPEPDPEAESDVAPEEDPNKAKNGRGKLPETENRAKSRDAAVPADRGEDEDDPLPEDDKDTVAPASKLPSRGKSDEADEDAPPPVERKGSKSTAEAIKSRLSKLTQRE